ncbi:hypothetical protein BDA96_04G337800 [Sorghum bicolor]|jgi:hypothetical protein|uniref:Uncharacterized protein n=1 Tax=Sorghum bicolor TaxID=4558 RepID=A0A921R7E1_SORBI|nr:hypothetical protein BDA96_04G337800 [Sorghum bicolor]
MASGGYYYDQSAGYGGGGGSAAPFHLLVFLGTVALLGATSLYSRYESAVESLVDQVRFAVVLSPLLLLLAVQYWAATAGSRRPRGGALSSLLVGDQPSSYAGAGWGGQHHQREGPSSSSPWGVALALALVLLLVSYQSCFQDLWFPLVKRR